MTGLANNSVCCSICNKTKSKIGEIDKACQLIQDVCIQHVLGNFRKMINILRLSQDPYKMVGVICIEGEELYPENTESDQSSRMLTGNKSV